METEIETRIRSALEPQSVEVVCVDARTGKYRVTVVAEAFAGKSLIQRHRAVNAAVRMNEEATQAQVHALEIDAKAPDGS
jgi:BolA protein